MLTAINARPSSSFNGQMVATGILFLINPLLGLVLALLVVLNSPNDYSANRREILLFVVTAAAWISLVNITKTITGDQVVYTRMFLGVPENGLYGTVFDSWGGTGKEPFYSFITWVLYYLSGGSVRLFYFDLSFAMYILHFLAAYKVARKIDAPKYSLICGILVLTFFTQYFVMTLQLVRQMLAAGVVIYAIACKAEDGKNHWCWLVAAVLIHTSSAYLALLSLVPWFYSWLTTRRWAIVLACFVPVVVFSSAIGNALGGSTGVSALDYGLSMYGNETYSDGGFISLGIMAMVFVPLTLSVIVSLMSYRKAISSDNQEEIDVQRAILPISYMALFLMLFVLMFSKAPLIQYRFFYYSYSFIPLLIPLLIRKRPEAGFYCFVASAFFMVRFFVLHQSSAWDYAPTLDLFVQPITYYFTGDFSPYYFM